MLTAIINQELCVKCTLCIDACPFDAITGSIGTIHTVLADVCVGCKLCVEPCPVDCIDLVPITTIMPNQLINTKQIVAKAKEGRKAKIARMQSQEIAKFSTQDDLNQDLAKISEYFQLKFIK